MIEMLVDSLRAGFMDSSSISRGTLYNVLLKDKTSDRYLPIVVGSTQANLISSKIRNDYSERPDLLDLLNTVMTKFGIELEKVVIYGYEDDSFFTKIILNKGGIRYPFEARTSDAISLSISKLIPVNVEEDVLEKNGVTLDDAGAHAEKPYYQIVRYIADTTQELLKIAGLESKRLNNGFVGTGHLLLALMKENSVSTMLTGLEVHLDVKNIEALVANESPVEESSLTTATKDLIQSSIDKAFALSDTHRVRPEHILMAMVSSEGVAGDILRKYGVTLEKIYFQILRQKQVLA